MDEQAPAGSYPDQEGNMSYWDDAASTELVKSPGGDETTAVNSSTKKDGAFSKLGAVVKKAAADRQTAKEELARDRGRIPALRGRRDRESGVGSVGHVRRRNAVVPVTLASQPYPCLSLPPVGASGRLRPLCLVQESPWPAGSARPSAPSSVSPGTGMRPPAESGRWCRTKVRQKGPRGCF